MAANSRMTIAVHALGKGIRPALGHVYGQIEQALRRELAVVSVADVLRETLQAR